MLRVIFVVRRAETLFSNYISIVRALCLKGHHLTVLFDKNPSSKTGLRQLQELETQFPNLINYQQLFLRSDWFFSIILLFTRSLWTYRRYLVVQGQSSFYEERWRRTQLPFLLQILVSFPLVDFILKTSFIDRLLHFIEENIPPGQKIIDQIQQHKPDVVIVPIGNMRPMSCLVQYLKAAVALRIPTVSTAHSWDSLTTKNSITTFPDIFLLWNSLHGQRIIEHHGIPPGKIRIIGAVSFDRWFVDLKPSCSRSEFYTRYGLKPDIPYILYLGSAAGTVKNELWLIAQLRKKLDNSIQIVARPHPSNAKIYEDFAMNGVVIVPHRRTLPNVKNTLQLSYDTFYYAAVVTGIYTSAMFEAQIMDKPLVVLLTDYYKKTQVEAQHFQDFIKGGSVDLANTLEEFEIILKQILNGHDDKKDKRRTFVKTYIRPLGLELSAGEAAAREIEALVKCKHDS